MWNVFNGCRNGNRNTVYKQFFINYNFFSIAKLSNDSRIKDIISKIIKCFYEKQSLTRSQSIVIELFKPSIKSIVELII